jgi:hypothetical protein
VSEAGALHLWRFSFSWSWRKKVTTAERDIYGMATVGSFGFWIVGKGRFDLGIFVYAFVCMYAAREVRRCLLN